MATVVLAGVPVLAYATPFTPPTGNYRLIFNTADVLPNGANSTLITVYNNFARSEADANTIGLPTLTWKAIASTPTVNAVTNVSCGALCDATVPDGTKIADSTDALFQTASADLLHVINEDQNDASNRRRRRLRRQHLDRRWPAELQRRWQQPVLLQHLRAQQPSPGGTGTRQHICRCCSAA